MKRIVFVLALLVLVAGASFAATEADLGKLNTAMENILKIMTGKVVKAILSIGLAGIFIGMAMNRENSDMQKKLLVFAIATGGLLGASNLMDFLFKETSKLIVGVM